MSMIVMQTAIARLCVDAEFRQGFLNDPDRAMEALDLTPGEVESIKALDMLAVREYAASLVAKRTGLIRKWFSVPLAFLERSLGAHQVSHILRDYGVEHLREGDELGGEMVRAEYEHFRDYLRDLISRKGIDLPGFKELLRFESIKFLMVQDPEISGSAAQVSKANSNIEAGFTEEFRSTFRPALGGHARLLSLDFNVPEFIEQFEAEPETASLEPDPVEVLLFKKARSMAVDTSVINLPMKTLLEMCNGEMTINSILSSLVSEYATAMEIPEEELVDDCLAVLEQLQAAGAISFVK